ncbi:Exocyst complex component 2 [Entamoeba marina]
MDTYDRFRPKTWDDGKDFVFRGYVSMENGMNALNTTAVQLEGKNGYDYLEILTENSKNIDDKLKELKSNPQLFLDSEQFNPELYLSQIHNDTSFHRLVNGPLRLETMILHKNKEIMHLVESHFDQFINCKDTLDRMNMLITKAKINVENKQTYLDQIIKVQKKYDELLNSLSSVKQLTDLKTRVDQGKKAIGIIERARFVFKLPSHLRQAGDNREDDKFISLFNRSQDILQNTEVSIFQDVLNECNNTAQRFADNLLSYITQTNLSRNDYDRSLATLFELKQFPVITLRENPVIFLLRSHRDSLRKSYDDAYESLTVPQSTTTQIQLTSFQFSTKSSKTQTHTETNVVDDQQCVLVRQCCEQIITHLPKLIGIIHFSANRIIVDEDDRLQKTPVLFEDGTFINVSYSPHTTSISFLDQAVETYKLTHPTDTAIVFELCSIASTPGTELDIQSGNNKILDDAVVVSEGDTPHDLMKRWTTASSEITRSFYIRTKVGITEKESTSDRSVYVVKIVSDFCSAMARFFSFQIQDKFRQNMIDKICLQELEKVLVFFQVQKVDSRFLAPLEQTHHELVEAFIHRITKELCTKISLIPRNEEVFDDPSSGIISAFQRRFNEDFKLLRELIKSAHHTRDNVDIFFTESTNALHDMLISEAQKIDELLNGTKDIGLTDKVTEITDIGVLTPEQKLLSLAQNSNHASGRVLREIYQFCVVSLLSKGVQEDVITISTNVSNLLKKFGPLQEQITQIYIDYKTEFFRKAIFRVDAAKFDDWDAEDETFEEVDEYALDLLSELVLIKHELHVFCPSRENIAVAEIVAKVVSILSEVSQKSESQHSIVVRLKWLVGAELIMKCCSSFLEKSDAETVVNEMKNALGDKELSSRDNRHEIIEKALNNFKYLASALNRSVDVSRNGSLAVSRTKTSRNVRGVLAESMLNEELS